MKFLFFVAALIVGYLPIGFLGVLLSSCNDIGYHTGGFITTLMFFVMLGDIAVWKSPNKKKVVLKLIGLLVILNSCLYLFEYLINNIFASYIISEYTIDGITLSAKNENNFLMLLIFSVVRFAATYILFKIFKKRPFWPEIEAYALNEYKKQQEQVDTNQPNEEATGN